MTMFLLLFIISVLKHYQVLAILVVIFRRHSRVAGEISAYIFSEHASRTALWID